jgi:hypothetical protein
MAERATACANSTSLRSLVQPSNAHFGTPKSPDSTPRAADRLSLRAGSGRVDAGRRRLGFVQLRRLAGYAGGACFPREAGKLSTGVAMRALPGKASVLIADL